MDNLIPIINRVQDILSSVGFAHEKVDLPQIAVVGAQSVGKSSIIEGLVCRDFLPRGSGIVTRRPLLLQLRHITSSEEWGEFAHLPGKRFCSFHLIRDEIVEETERVASGSKAISPEPIRLKIYSNKVIDLTLIDLPGITKVPVGDQPTDIEEQVRELILSYIKHPNCIILAITAASTDLANSDSLKVARAVDPSGNRTIGVITKCDTIEEGFDALDLLLGKTYPLKLGYIGIVSRNQRETLENKPIEAALEDEDRFFSSNPKYQLMRNCGTRFLAQKLNQILLIHIEETLPEIKTKIGNLLLSTEKELASYGDLSPHDDNSGALLLNFFSRFSRHFEDALDGRSVGQTSGQLTAGARIKYIFQDWYARILADFDPLSGLSDLEIRTTIRNTAGPKASLFVPEAAFEILVKRQIRHLEGPSLKCVEQVYLELQDIVEKCDLPEMKRYLNLREHILSVVKGVLAKLLEPANRMIQNIIQMQVAYINTSHPDFIPNVANMLQSMDSVGTPPQHVSVLSNPTTSTAASAATATGGSTSPTGGANKQQSIDKSNKTLNKIEASQMGSTKCVPIQETKSADTTAPANGNQQSSSIFGFLWRTKGVQPTDEFGAGLTGTDSATSSFSNTGYTSLSSNATRNDTPYIHLPIVPSRLIPSDPPSDREVMEERLIKALIFTYFRIVRQSVADCVPKAIMCFMVNSAKEIIPRQLVSTLYKDSLYTELLKEKEHVVQKREHLREMQKKLRDAIDVLAGIPDANMLDSSKRYWEG